MEKKSTNKIEKKINYGHILISGSSSDLGLYDDHFCLGYSTVWWYSTLIDDWFSSETYILLMILLLHISLKCCAISEDFINARQLCITMLWIIEFVLYVVASFDQVCNNGTLA